MITTLLLTSLLGAAVSYPLLRRLAAAERTEFERKVGAFEARVTRWLPGLALIPFVAYSVSFGLLLTTLAAGAAIFPVVAFAPLLLLMPEWVIWLAVLVGVGVLIGMVCKGGGLWLKGFDGKRAATFLAAGVLLAEAATASANAAIAALGAHGDWTVLPGMERAGTIFHDTDPRSANRAVCKLCRAIRDIKSR